MCHFPFLKWLFHSLLLLYFPVVSCVLLLLMVPFLTLVASAPFMPLCSSPFNILPLKAPLLSQDFLMTDCFRTVFCF